MEIKQIKETCLYIEDIEKAKSFYHSKLGFPIINEIPGSHIFFRVGSSVLLCFIPEASKVKKAPPPHFAYGHQHIAFEVSPQAYGEWKRKLTALGIEIIQEQGWKDNLQSCYFKDPEGHVLEIVPEGIWE